MQNSLSNNRLVSLAEQFGTPLYVYDAGVIRRQYGKLTGAFAGQDVRFFYACKALTNISILKVVLGTGAGIDCSSINEARLALLAGFPPERILYTSNGIAFDEIEEAVSLGIHVNIDSVSNLRKFGERFGHSYPVGIRLRPNIMAGGNIKISTGHDRSKFGIPVDQVDEILEVIRSTNLHIRTLHIHTGSEIKDVDVFVRGIEVLFNLIPKFHELEVIDLGGGFKVAYKEGDAETDIPLLAQRVREAFASHPNPGGKPLQVWFEPGKFIVSEAGSFVTRVNVMKQSGAVTFVSVNSGFNHLIRPMFYDAFHRIVNVSNPAGAPHTYTIVGNICETDTFGWDREISEVREGDYLMFCNAGAYGFEMSSHFNSRLKPAEVLVDGDSARIIRRRDTFEDLLRGQEWQ